MSAILEKPWEAEWRREEPKPPPVLDDAAQLVVDDHLIESKYNLVRRLNPPQKRPDPVLVPTLPWEGQHVICYGAVLKLPGSDVYRMYYKGANPDPDRERGEATGVLSFAESTDLVNWEKPLSKDRPYGRFESTNTVGFVGHDCASVILDETDGEHPFKLMCSPWDWWLGLQPAVSADGLSWEKVDVRVARLGDRMSFFYNPVNQRYVAWSRCYAVKGARSIFAAQSEDFHTWDAIPRLTVEADAHDPPGTQLYGGTGFWYESQFVGYLEMYRGALGRLYAEFMSSRDGVAWQREEQRQIFLDNGPHGARDGYWIFPADNAPIRFGDQLYLHYSERAGPHSPHAAPKPGQTATIGLATMRVDGFASLDAGGQDAMLLTKPCRFEGKGELTVNACPFTPCDGEHAMRLRVEVLDEAGAPIPGFTADDAVEVSGDRLDHPIRWQQRDSLAELKDRPIRLAFRLFNSRFYSFRIA